MLEQLTTPRHLKRDKEPQQRTPFFVREPEAEKLEAAGLINASYFKTFPRVVLCKVLIWKLTCNFSCQIHVVVQCFHLNCSGVEVLSSMKWNESTSIWALHLHKCSFFTFHHFLADTSFVLFAEAFRCFPCQYNGGELILSLVLQE